MFRKLTAAAVASVLISSTVLAAQPKVNPDLFPSSNSKLYVAQGLLSDNKSWPTAYELLRNVIKNDKSLNEVSMDKVKKAASVIKAYNNMEKPLNRLFNYGQYKERPYLEAQLYLAEALMDSRIFINQSFDSETIFIDNLLKNYFFPTKAENVKITYPSSSTYAFNKWALTAQNVANAQVEQAYTEPSFFDSNSSSSSSQTKSKTTKPATTQKITPKPTQPKTVSKPYVTKSGEEIQEKGIVEDVIAVADAVSTVSDGVEEIIEKYDEYQLERSRINNKYLAQSMLIQAIAEPQSALVDPQLQEFLKGVKIEYSLGQTSMPSRLELEALIDDLGENIIKGDISKGVSIDVSKLYGLKREGTHSAIQLEYRSVPGDGEKAVLYVISTVSGEDLMFGRMLQQATNLVARESVRTAVANSAVGSADKIASIPSAMAKFGSALQAGVKVGKEADKLGKVGTAFNAAKQYGGLVLSKAEAPFQAYVKLKTAAGAGLANNQAVQYIMKNGVVQKVASIGKGTATKISNFAKSGGLFKMMVGLGVIAEVTTGVIEMKNASTDEERKNAREEMLARTGGQLTYLVPFVGVAAMTVDFAHYTMGFPYETADIFRGAGKLGAAMGLWWAGYNTTTFALLKFENRLRIPRHEVYFYKHSRNLESIEDAVNGKQAIYDELQDSALKNLILIYNAHREFGAESNYDFGERLAEYKYAFEQNVETANICLQEIADEIDGLRYKQQQELSQKAAELEAQQKAEKQALDSERVEIEEQLEEERQLQIEREQEEERILEELADLQAKKQLEAEEKAARKAVKVLRRKF